MQEMIKRRQKETVRNLQTIAAEVRQDILTMSYRAQSAHTGGALSSVEILVALYWKILRNDPKNPEDPRRDRLVFSKAHDAKALYAVLSRRGYFPQSVLDGYEQNDGLLPGHSTRHCVPGVEVSAGGLGHGLSMACGMAYAIRNSEGHPRVFAVLSDGECNEGSTWEAALFAGHHSLANLVAVVDYNGLQGYGYTKEVLDLEPFAAKWRSFGWGAAKVSGHDIRLLLKAFRTLPLRTGKPTVLLARTIKGLGGVSKHINQVSSQYKAPTQEELQEALRRLNL